MHSIRISEDAYFDIEEMFAHLSQDNKKAANELRQKIYNEIKELQDFPFRHPVVQEEDAPGVARGYRYIIMSPYIVFYRVLDYSTVIARVLHLKQNWLRFL